MPKLKVAYITTVDNTLRYLLFGQLHNLQQAGYEVVTISSPGSNVAEIEAAGIRHIPVAMTRNITPIADLVSLWHLYRIMRRERFTIVHTFTPKAGILGQVAACIARVPITVRTWHGLYVHQQMSRAVRRFFILLEKLTAPCSDLIQSVNQEDIDLAVREKVCSPNKTEFLGDGIDLTRFDPSRYRAEDIVQKKAELGLPADAPVIGFVGRLAARRKGFLFLLQAARQVVRRCPQARFIIVGEADYSKPDAIGSDAAREHHVEDACLFLGRQTHAELPLLYLLMDLFVLPSLFEGLPQVVMEASAMKVPSIVTDVKGNREAIEPGRSGLLVPYGDPAALSEAIVGLIENKAKARRMGQEARRIALERFDEQRVFEQVKAAYAGLLLKKRLKPCARAKHSEEI